MRSILFHFNRSECEYNTYERLIRLELERNDLAKEVKELRQLSYRWLLLENTIETQAQMIKELKEDRVVQEHVNDELKDEIEKLKAVAGDTERKPTVAVKARLSRSVTLKTKERVVYDIVVTNEGNAYDPGSGLFHAPVNGTYVIAATACATNSQYASLNLMHHSQQDGKKVIGNLRCGDDAFKDCNTEITTAGMTAGSSLWVEYAQGNSALENIYWNSFTVMLVN